MQLNGIEQENSIFFSHCLLTFSSATMGRKKAVRSVMMYNSYDLSSEKTVFLFFQ